MRVKFKAGAEFDVMTSREMRHELARHRQRMGQLAEANRPIPKTVEGSITLDAAGFGVIDLGTPAAGRTWNVRRVSATYQDPFAVLAAGVAAIFRGNEQSPFTFVERIPNGTQLPASDKFSADQFVLMQTERLFVVISGGTVSVPAFASAQVIDGPRSTVYELDLDEPGIEQGLLSNVV